MLPLDFLRFGGLFIWLFYSIQMGLSKDREVDEARGLTGGVSESIEVHLTALEKVSYSYRIARIRSRRESNPHLRFRKPPFYPLNYGNT